jgi:hypothetical protein
MPYACVLQPEREEGAEVGVLLLLLLASCRGSRIYKERHVIQTRDEEEHYCIMLLMSTYVVQARRQRRDGIECKWYLPRSLSTAPWTGLVSTIVRMR